METIKTNLLDEIKTLYKQVEKKNDFFQVVKNEMGGSISSIKTNWFSMWSIPETKLAELENILAEYIQEQNKKISA